MPVEIRLLGGFAVLVDGRPVDAAPWRRRHAAALVKLLALQPGRRLLREQLIDTLWPDVPVDVAAPRLHKAAHFARAALGVRDGVVLAADQVQLLPAAEVVVDVEVFDRMAQAALATGETEALERAIAAYPGDLLPEDLYEQWAADHREPRRLRYLELLRRTGRWDLVVELDPADEHAHLQLVRATAATGDRQGALARFDRLVAALDEELGIGPSEAAFALREEVVALQNEAGPPLVRPFTPVPAPATPTVGREADIRSVLHMLDGARIVTLLGPGGVGKTRLAAEVALRRSAVTGDRACFVDLTLVTDAGEVLDLVARELGLQQGDRPVSDHSARQALADEPLLVVLDNFEHVIDAADVAPRILGWSPQLRVLATSRVRLHVAGEHIRDVVPLPVDNDSGAPGMPDRPGSGHDAVALFNQVARAVDPTFDVERHRADVVEICRRLDGLPLAIELAAGHVRTFTPALLRSRLAVRLGSPTGAGRDLPPRQLTIPATIGWSLALLHPEERLLFTRMGVFGSAVPVDAVEQVCGEGLADVVGSLSRLVDSSLVQRRDDGAGGSSGEPRFGMLSLLREQARVLLAAGPGDAGDPDGTGCRHAHYYAGLLDEIEEHRWNRVGRWMDLVAAAFPEIRAAHAWAVAQEEAELAGRITAALTLFWHRSGHHVEGRAWVDHALARRDRLHPTTYGRVLLASGVLAWTQDPDSAREPFGAAAELFRELGEDRQLAYALALHAGTYLGQPGSYDLALRECDEAIAIARRLGEPHLLGIALNEKGELARVHGDDDLARELYEEGRTVAAEAGDEAHVAVFLANLSYLAGHRGEHAEAWQLCHDALAICWRLGRGLMSAWTLSQLACAEVGLGRPERAAVLVGASDAALGAFEGGRTPGDVEEHEVAVAELKVALGEDGYARWYAHGRELSLGDAVALALSEERPSDRSARGLTSRA